MAEGNQVWLGGGDLDQEGVWRWYNDGDQFYSGGIGGSAVNGAYQNFDVGEPDNATIPNSNGEDFLALAGDGTWFDWSQANNHLAGYIVEWDAADLIQDQGNTFSLTDNAGGRFEIDSGTGEISVLNGDLLNHEADMTHDVTVRVENSTGGSSDQVFTIDVNNVNEAPEIMGATTSVFIKEIHYDNDLDDQGEAIEVVAPTGTDLSGWSLVRYSGADGEFYGTDFLSESGVGPNIVFEVVDQGNGVSTFTISYPMGGLQNGDADGVALVDDLGNVVQFLSYEGTLTAVDGPAAGLTSTDIGVAETGDTPIGGSIQLTDNGYSAENVNTFGSENTCLLYTSPSPRDQRGSRMPSSA